MRSKLLITILIIVLLVVYYLLGMDYMKQRQENDALTSLITDITQILREMPELPQDLEQRLTAAQASLAAEQSAFLISMNSTEVVDTILKLADGSDVKAIPLATQPWSTQKVGEHSYDVFRLNVAVEGSFSQLLTFVAKLENGEFKTLIVEDLSVTGVAEQSGEETVSGGTMPVVASLNLAIYAQPLSSN